MNELHLFAGAGGGILGGEMLGHTTVCAVEIEEYPRRVLLQRQRDGILPKFPIWDDIRTFDGKPWRGEVDIVCGGFPCQDISISGSGAGIDGERSGLWSEMARVVREIRPRYVFVENSPELIRRGLGRVVGDLARMGYDSRWCVLGSHNTNGCHKRKRIWILADSFGFRVESNSKHTNSEAIYAESLCPIAEREWGKVEPKICRTDDEMDSRLDRLKAIGNGQDPTVAATAFRILSA